MATDRSDYSSPPLARSDLAPDPIAQFTRWFADAQEAGVYEPEAMLLSTTAPAGLVRATRVGTQGMP